jgi:cytidyltransferase-like protein
MDGCFDLMHYGHANALRQAKAVGDQLVVGLIPDSEIMRCKGPPVLNETERLRLVESIKWVDEVITGACLGEACMRFAPLNGQLGVMESIKWVTRS